VLFRNRVAWPFVVGGIASLCWLVVWLASGTRDVENLSDSTLDVKAASQKVPDAKAALGDFRWPSRDEWLTFHGISENAVLAGEVQRLRRYFNGEGVAQVANDCAKRFGPQGERIGAPAQENLACLGWKVSRALTPKTEKKNLALLELQAKRLPVKTPNAKVAKAGVSQWGMVSRKSYKDLLGNSHLNYPIDVRNFWRDVKAGGNDCKEASARAVLRNGLEEFLPARDIWKMSEALYAWTASCLNTEHPAYESLHLRMGLLYLERSEFQKAAVALRKASLTERAVDETRIYFWLGYLDALKAYGGNGHFSEHENPWWERLDATQPMSLHAVIARHLRGRDPASIVTSRYAPTVAVYSGEKWTIRNLWSFLFVLSVGIGDSAMEKRLVELMNSGLNISDFDTSLFFSLAQRHAGDKESSFRTVQSALRQFGANKMSRGSLSLLFPTHFQTEIKRAKECSDPALTLALIRQESSFDENAISDRGAVGLMQLLPAVGKSLSSGGLPNLRDPAKNVDIGCKHFSALLKQFDGERLLTVAAYNSGAVPVRKWRARYDDRSLLLFADLIPFRETRHFVANVLAGSYWYGVVIGAGDESGVPFKGLPAGIVPEPEDLGIRADTRIEVLPPSN
jgi:soluble lytic murein transglycosylase